MLQLSGKNLQVAIIIKLQAAIMNTTEIKGKINSLSQEMYDIKKSQMEILELKKYNPN